MKSKRKSKLPKEPSAKSLHNKIWPLCRTIIRAMYGNECFTCGAKKLSGGNLHTGHFIPKSTCGAYLKYDIRNLRPQCYRCNIFGGGMGAEFYRRMVAEKGQAHVDRIFADRALSVKLKDRVLELLPIYQKLAKEL